MGTNNISIEQMRRSRQSVSVAYTNFINSRKYYSAHVFCFYEGEDRKYYDHIVREYFDENFITIIAGNKINVIKILNKIQTSNLYNDVCVMFFIDKDYDVSLSDINCDLFETPCYSIENLYVQEECFIKLLKSEFGLNEIDLDYKKCLNDFKNRTKEFNEIIMDFNALLYLSKNKSNNEFTANSIKTSNLIDISVMQVSKSNKYDKIIRDIKNKLNVSDMELQKTKKLLINNENYSLMLRGKNQLDFFVGFVLDLRNLYNKNEYFSKKFNSIKINITSNRLSELRSYATVPSSLRKFLEQHKNFFEMLKKNGTQEIKKTS